MLAGMERVTYRIAGRQHGLVTRAQLRTAGVPEDTVDCAVREARLVHRERGVYAVPGAPATSEQEVMAAVLRAGAGARATGERMLALSGLPGLDRAGPFTVLVSEHRRVRGVRWPVRRTDLDGPGGHATIVGIASFSPARNSLESAVDSVPERLARLVDSLRWTDRRHLAGLAELVRTWPHHTGAVRLRRSGLLDERAAESPPERRLARLLAHLDPEGQAWVAPDLRVDLVLRRHGLVVEYDGRGVHSGPGGRRRDALRDRRLERLGLRVLHVVAEDLRDPAALLARVARIVDDDVARTGTVAEPRLLSEASPTPAGQAPRPDRNHG
jgi:very-short-patch-repair endonuclease